MKLRQNPRLGETLYETELENGLTVKIYPKSGYHKIYAILTTNYGSIDKTFIPAGETDYVTVPDGIAHFLEHKLFEKKIMMRLKSLVATGQAQMRLRVLRERVIYFQQPVTCEKIWIFYLILCRNLIFQLRRSKKKRASLAKKSRCIMMNRIGAYSIQ